MKSKKLNIYLVEDLLKDLLQIDSQILLHTAAKEKFVLAQFEERKLRVFNKLINHLSESGVDRQDPKMYYYINQLIGRFFPEAKHQPGMPEYESLNSLLIVPPHGAMQQMSVQEREGKYGE